MMENLALLKNRVWSRESTFALTVAGALTILFVGIIAIAKGNTLALLIFPLFTLLIITISNFNVASTILVVSLFLDYQLIAFSTAVWFALPLGISFALSHTSFQWKDFATPITSAIVLYGLCILPSFLYVARPLVSFFMLFNPIAFLIVMYSLVAGIKKYSDIYWLVAVYLVMVFLNSFDVFRLSFAGKSRPFGFGGVWFVDYSALGVCLSVAAAFISRDWKRYLFVAFALFVTIALMLTQTRNTWVSGLLTLFVLAIYLFLRPDTVGLPRKHIVVSFILGGILLAVTAAAVLTFNPRIERRVGQLTNQSQTVIDQEGFAENSLVSRLFIWDTALNAFRAHPVVGIGVYAFRYASHQYSKLPELLYYRYVAFRSAHQSQIAVLAETGIIGFIGFSVFLFTLLREAFKSIHLASTESGKHYALVGAICVSYCTISMFFTDAWLWGQQIVLLGIVCGSVFAMRKLSAEKA